MEYFRPDIASWVSHDAFSGQRKQPGRWILEVFGQVSSIVTLLVLFIQVGQERLAIEKKAQNWTSDLEGNQDALERKDVLVFMNEVYGWDLNLCDLPPNHS
jgi:hypothetical protein